MQHIYRPYKANAKPYNRPMQQTGPYIKTKPMQSQCKGQTDHIKTKPIKGQTGQNLKKCGFLSLPANLLPTKPNRGHIKTKRKTGPYI